MFEALLALTLLGGVAFAVLLTKDLCSRYPVAGALGLAAGAVLIAFGSWAVTPRSDTGIGVAPSTGQVVGMLICLAHIGIAAVLVAVAVVQAFWLGFRDDVVDDDLRDAWSEERTGIGEPPIPTGE